jgi:hypothetical protein
MYVYVNPCIFMYVLLVMYVYVHTMIFPYALLQTLEWQTCIPLLQVVEVDLELGNCLRLESGLLWLEI